MSQSRRDVAIVAPLAAVASLLALVWSASHQQLLLYGDAVAHLHIARRVFDAQDPAVSKLGSVWLPLPHILLIPFVMVRSWWQSGLAAALPSMMAYLFAVIAMFRLARLCLPRRWSALATSAFALNPGLLYMQTSAMTEPLFLALFLWAVVWMADCIAALDTQQYRSAAAALTKCSVVLACAVLSRYDGWVLTFLAAMVLLKHGGKRFFTGPRSLKLAALVFTILVLAAPLAWLLYNARYFHDPLDFLRGPYSAQAIEARTALPGHAPHPGYHRPWIAFRYYLRVATLGAAQGWLGNALILLLAAAGTFLLLRRNARFRTAGLLLWFPLAFYTYSVAWGSVPIFMPVWPPFAFYNTRYGMELLPALALFPVAALWQLGARWRREAVVLAGGMAAVAVNAVALAIHTPIVLQEARANSATRLPFERQLAAAIQIVPRNQKLLMYTSAYAGALQDAGRPLRDTIDETDYYPWAAALADPASQADYVVAVDGDPVAAAVREHPGGLQQIAVITSQGQPRAILYRSEKTQAP